MPSQLVPRRLPRWMATGLDNARIVLGGLETVAAALTRYAAFRPAFAWLAFLLLFIAAATPILDRPLWFDEILSRHIAGLRTMGEIWSALHGGADSQFPFFYALVRGSFAVFGEGEWSLRLPPLLGFLLLSACLYLFVRQWGSAAAAWAAALAPLLPAGAAYMGEGRAYGIVVGFSGAALLCWQRSRSQPEWSPWLAIASLCIAGATSSHATGVYAFAPLVCGESLHQLAGGRVRLLRWVTLAAALVPIVAMSSLLSDYFDAVGIDRYDTPTLFSLASSYRILIGAALGPPLACLCVLAAVKAESGGVSRPSAASLPLPEVVAGLGFLAVPALAVVTALATKGPWVMRYGLGGLIGFGVLAGVVTIFLERRRSEFASFFLCAMIAGLSLQIADRWRKVESSFAVPETLLADHTDLPIVVEGPLDYLQLTYYSPQPIRERLVALVDPDAAGLYVGVRRGDRALELVQPWAPTLRIERPASFFLRYRRFLVFRGTEPGWVLARLTGEGAQATLVRFRNTDALYDVRLHQSAKTPER